MPHKCPEARKAYHLKYYLKNKEKLDRQRGEWAQINLERRREIANKWARANKDKTRFKKAYDRYGVTEEQFWAMYNDQQGCCAGCLKEFIRTPDIDHNHDTGKVRGLLCNNCNRGIGHLKENIDTMLRLIDYLKRNVNE